MTEGARQTVTPNSALLPDALRLQLRRADCAAKPGF
jgi:hypothetical protein